MSGLKLTVRGDGLRRFTEAVATLGEKKAVKAYTRALNEAGKPSANKAIGSVAKQMGVSRAVVSKRAKILHKGAGAGKLSYDLSVAGGYLLMRDFGPSQSAKGVRAGPWGKRRLFRGAFIQSTKLHGNVFHRTTNASEPIQNMYGPAVPKEIVKGATGETWQREAADRLEKRTVHHLK